MTWVFWKEKEEYIYILPLVASYNDTTSWGMKFGWLRWRCGFVKYKEK